MYRRLSTKDIHLIKQSIGICLYTGNDDIDQVKRVMSKTSSHPCRASVLIVVGEELQKLFFELQSFIIDTDRSWQVLYAGNLEECGAYLTSLSVATEMYSSSTGIDKNVESKVVSDLQTSLRSKSEPSRNSSMKNAGQKSNLLQFHTKSIAEIAAAGDFQLRLLGLSEDEVAGILRFWELNEDPQQPML